MGLQTDPPYPLDCVQTRTLEGNVPEIIVNEQDLRAVINTQASQIASLQAAQAALTRTISEQEVQIAALTAEESAKKGSKK